MYPDSLILQIHKLLKMAFEQANIDVEKEPFPAQKLCNVIERATNLPIEEHRNIENIFNYLKKEKTFESKKNRTKEVLAYFVLLKLKKVDKVSEKEFKLIYWNQFKILYCEPAIPVVPKLVLNPLEQKPIMNYLLGTWWKIYNRSPVTKDIHLHLMHICPKNAEGSTPVISYLAGDDEAREECTGFAYSDESGHFTIINQVAGEEKRRQIHIKIKNENSRLSQLMWGQVNLISDNANVISYVNIFEYIGTQKPIDLRAKRYKYESEVYHQLSEGLKWYFLSAQRSYLKMPQEGFTDISVFEQLAQKWEKEDLGESYEEVFQEIVPIPIHAYFENTVWKLYNKSISGNIHENILRIGQTKVGKLTKMTLTSASEEYESYKGYCYISNDNYIIANLNTVPSRHKACHLKIKFGKGVQPLAMIGQANYLMSMKDDICTDNIVLEKITDIESKHKPHRHSKKDYSKLPPAVREYFQLNSLFRLMSFDVIANLMELRKCVRERKERETPFDKILQSYYQDYWIYYQYPDKKKDWNTYEWELKFATANSNFIFMNSQDTDAFLSQQIYRSSKNMITFVFKNEYEGLTLEFVVPGILKPKMECFTGTLTGVRDLTSKHATVSILMVLKSVKDFKQLEDERVHKFFAQQTVKCLEPQKLDYFSLDDI